MRIHPFYRERRIRRCVQFSRLVRDDNREGSIADEWYATGFGGQWEKSQKIRRQKFIMEKPKAVFWIISPTYIIYYTSSIPIPWNLTRPHTHKLYPLDICGDPEWQAVQREERPTSQNRSSTGREANERAQTKLHLDTVYSVYRVAQKKRTHFVPDFWRWRVFNGFN